MEAVKLVLNALCPVQPHSFELEEDTSSYSTYMRGGIVTQFKRPKQLAFQPLQAALQSPGEFLFSDFSKIERPGLLHVAFQALDSFQVSHPSFRPVEGLPGVVLNSHKASQALQRIKASFCEE